MTLPRSLSGLKNRSEKVAGRGQILTNSQANSRSIGQEGGEIWIGQALLQPISFKPDRLLAACRTFIEITRHSGHAI